MSQPSSEADAVDPDDWRSQLQNRYATVSGFLTLLPNVTCFGANAEGLPVLEANVGTA
jgi:hypothetical protein